MKNFCEWYIVSFLNERQTTVGGVRATKLNKFLNAHGEKSTLLTRIGVNDNEISISEPRYAKAHAITKFVSPDSSIFWATKVYSYLKHKNNFILLTTSPLHGIHKIGLKLKEQAKKDFFWIADFRDPFTLNPYYKPVFYKRILDKVFEKRVLTNADVLVFNTDLHKQEYLDVYKSLVENKSVVIRNGYDIAVSNELCERQNKIIYSGGIYKGEALGVCASFIKALRRNGMRLQCDFIGEAHPDFKNYSEIFTYKGRVKFEEVPTILSRYKYGLVYLPKEFKNSGRVTAKFYDYIGAGLIPICINPSLEMKNIIQEIGYGIIINEDMFLHSKLDFDNEYIPLNKKDLISKYSRNNQFRNLLNFIRKKA